MGNFEFPEWPNLVPQFHTRLSRDSPSSFRIWWTALMMSPNLVAWGKWLLELRLQSAVVIFVRLQISQFGSLGKCVNKLCFPFDLWRRRASGRGGSGGLFRHLQRMLTLVPPKCPYIPATILASLAINHSMPALQPDRWVITLWRLQLNHLLNQRCQYHLITREQLQARSSRSCKVCVCHHS